MTKKIFDPEKMSKKSKRKSHSDTIVTKRVNFSWLKSRTACRAKAYMAYIGDRKKKRYSQIGTKRGYFTQCVLPRILKKFPRLYKEIRTYYHEHGRQLTRDQYTELLYARFINMYDATLTPTDEHPKHSSHKGIKEYYMKYLLKKQKKT